MPENASSDEVVGRRGLRGSRHLTAWPFVLQGTDVAERGVPTVDGVPALDELTDGDVRERFSQME